MCIRDSIYTGDKDVGIKVESQNAAYFYSPTIISRGSLDLLGGATVSLQGEKAAGNLWVQNIRLKSQGMDSESTLQTKLDLNENAYVANDLDIEANNSIVTLSGKYYGYSYNEQNTKTTSTARSDYSSAILVNGLNKMCIRDSIYSFMRHSGCITSQALCLWEYFYLCAHFCLKRLREKQDLVWATLNSWRVLGCVSDLDILYWH